MSDAKPATTIEAAYWERLALHDQDVWSTAPDDYVPRAVAHDGPTKPVHLKIAEILRRRRVSTDVQFLLTGQVGCGKSTELQRLVCDTHLVKSHEIVVLDAAAELNLARFVDVRMLLIAIAAQLAARLHERAANQAGWLGFAATEAQAVHEWIRVLGTRQTAVPDPSQVNAHAFLEGLSKKLLGLPADLKSDDTLRQGLQKAEVSQVRQLVVMLGDQLNALAERPVLVVVDNTDKIRDPDTMTHLFQAQLTTLRNLPFCWVITMPYALRFDPVAQLPQDLIVTLPNVKVVKRDAPGVLLDGARAFYRKLLFRLVAPELVDDTVIDRAALLSAGIPREFLRVMHHAFGVANDHASPKVLLSHLDLAAAELRRQMQPLHADPAITLQLELVHISTEKLRPEQRRLMGALLVVEYSNDVQWYDVHPLLAAEYDRRLDQRAARRKLARADTDALIADILAEVGGPKLSS